MADRTAIFHDRRSGKAASVDDLYEKHLAWAKGTEHEGDPETVAALRAHEKSGGLTRGQANKVADLAYIGGGGPDWRSQGGRGRERGRGPWCKDCEDYHW